MNLVILTPGFPANEQDTTCLPSIANFILALNQQNKPGKLTVVTFQYPFTSAPYYWHGIEVIPLAGKNHGGIRRAITWFKAYRALRKLNRGNPLNGILSLWLTECALVGNLFSKFNKMKHFIWLQGQDAKSSNQYVNRIRPEANKIIAISDFNRDDFYSNHHIKPFMVIENGINPLIFPVLNTGERKIDILGAGSLTQLKNYEQFIRIISGLKQTFPSIKAVIAGEGEEYEALKKLISQLELEKNVTLTGSVPHQEVLNLMNAAKIFLHTSAYEGSAAVLNEALYSGCQVISTMPLSHKRVEDLFVSGDREIITNKIISLLKENAAPKRIFFNSVDSSAGRILQLFRE